MAQETFNSFADLWPYYLGEHSQPATFTNPRWSFMDDWKMLALMLTGRLKP